MLLYPFYVFVRLSADVSYFLCCPRKSDAVRFLRAAKEIEDVCTQATFLLVLKLKRRKRLIVPEL